MSSVSKTLELLDYFTLSRPEIGLSQLCRLAHRDKATTYRGLKSLVENGFIEQNPITKRYRLGPALLQLAQTREMTVPRKSGATAPVEALAMATGETCHASILSGNTLYNLISVESPQHSIRVIVDIPTFPLHATSSGLCALAFGPEHLTDAATRSLTAFTDSTVTTPHALAQAITRTRRSGFGYSKGCFEPDVFSIAAPLFDQTAGFAGAISVATVASRFTPELEHQITAHLATASRDITHNWGGSVPSAIQKAWATAQLSPLTDIDTAI